VVLAAIHYSNLGIRIADHFFDAASARWIGANTWWASTLLHDGGRWLMRLVALGALVCWVASYRPGASPRLRAAAAYPTLSIVLSTSLVGALKSVTNVDCPWDLERYGGQILADVPVLPAWAESSRKRWIGLAIGITVEATLSISQQARGAHFLSHDLTSAALCWLVAVALSIAIDPKRVASPGSRKLPRDANEIQPWQPGGRIGRQRRRAPG
jgi:membrane-associated PAP2 superfamily phosphatase